MILKLIPLIALLGLFLLTLCTLSFSLGFKDLSLCEFAAPLMEFDYIEDSIENTKAQALEEGKVQDSVDESIENHYFNVAHPKKPNERIHVNLMPQGLTYELEGAKYFSTFKMDDSTCACMKETLKNTHTPGRFGKIFTSAICAMDSCYSKYFEKTPEFRNVDPSEAISRLAETLRHAELPLEGVMSAEEFQKMLNEHDQDSIGIFFVLFGKERLENLLPEDYEENSIFRAIKSLDCLVHQLKRAGNLVDNVPQNLERKMELFKKAKGTEL